MINQSYKSFFFSSFLLVPSGRPFKELQRTPSSSLGTSLPIGRKTRTAWEGRSLGTSEVCASISWTRRATLSATVQLSIPCHEDVRRPTVKRWATGRCMCFASDVEHVAPAPRHTFEDLHVALQTQTNDRGPQRFVSRRAMGSPHVKTTGNKKTVHDYPANPVTKF